MPPLILRNIAELKTSCDMRDWGYLAGNRPKLIMKGIGKVSSTHC